MDSLIFTGEILAGKRVALRKYGEAALKILKSYHGLWCFRYEFKEVKRPV